MAAVIKTQLSAPRFDVKGNLILLLKEADPDRGIVGQQVGSAKKSTNGPQLNPRVVVAEDLVSGMSGVGHCPGAVLAQPDPVSPSASGDRDTGFFGSRRTGKHHQRHDRDRAQPPEPLQHA